MRVFPLTLLLFCTCFFSEAQEMKRVKAYLDTLCAPGMHGRGYVSNGANIAAHYISDRFKEMSLHPFGDSYYQYFTTDINIFPGKLILKKDDTELIAGKDYIINSISGKGKGSGKVKYLDTMIFYNDAAQQKFLTENNKKNIFVYEAKYYSKLTELSPEFIQKIHEAKCIVELQDKKLVMGVSTSQFSHPFFTVKKEKFSTDVDKVRFRLDAELIHNYKTQNIIGYIKGKSHPDSFIVISAHYDHLGRMGKNVYFPGANDNGSGVSMLLELAYWYSRTEHAPEYSIVFIAFGAEEAGLLGSKFYTEHPIFPLKSIKFLLNLDLLGTGDDGMMVVNGSVFQDEYKRLVSINDQHNYLPAIKKRGTAANSDHFWFSERGVHSFFFYTLGGITAYHDILDRPETLPLTKFSGVFDLIKDFIDGF